MLTRIHTTITDKFIPHIVKYTPKKNEFLKGVYFLQGRINIKRKPTLTIIINNEVVISEQELCTAFKQASQKLINREIKEPVIFIFKETSPLYSGVPAYEIGCTIETKEIGTDE